MKKESTRKFAAILAATLTFGFAGVISPAAVNAEENYSFSACVQQKKSAHVILMMDESGSMYSGGEGGKGSDPKNLRIAGAEILLDRLQVVSDKFKSKINVQLAGFGDNYVVRSSPAWSELTPGSEATQKQLIQTTKVWADQSALNNSRETDLVAALSGVTQSFASAPEESCKLFVFFKDGEDFHYFNGKGESSEVPGFDRINELLADKKFDAANKEAVKELCREGGLGDQLRSDSNIYSYGIGVRGAGSSNQEGFQKFKSLIQGDKSEACGKGGALPAHGKYLAIDSVASLPSTFFDLLDESGEAAYNPPPGPFDLEMKHALTSFTVLTGGVQASKGAYKITLPSTCSVKDPIEFKAGENYDSDQNVGDGVTVRAKWVGDQTQAETLKIVFKHVDLADDSCWVGKWRVDPGNNDAKSHLSFDADLQVTAKFAMADPFIVPGKPGVEYTMQLGHPSDESNSAIALDSLDSELSLSVTGNVRDNKTKQMVASFETFYATKEDLATPRTLSGVKDLPFGDYELVLSLKVDVRDFKYPLTPITTYQSFKVQSDIAPPVVTTKADFGLIKGTERSKAELVIQGSPDEDFVLDFSDESSKVMANTFPEGFNYRLAFQDGEQQTITIPKGETVKFDVWIQAFQTDKNGDGEIHSEPIIGGQLSIASSPASRSDYIVPLVAEITAKQQASANGLIRALFVFVLMVIGLAISIGVLKAVSLAVARFPNGASQDYASNWATYISAPVSFSAESFTNLYEVRSQFGNDASAKDFFIDENRRRASAGEFTFEAKNHGLGLSDAGHGEDLTFRRGFSKENAKSAWVPLSLNASWAFFTTTSDLETAKSGGQGNGQLFINKLKFEDASFASLFEEFERDAGDTTLQELLKNVKASETLDPWNESGGATASGNWSPGFGDEPTQSFTSEPPKKKSLFGNKPKKDKAQAENPTPQVDPNDW